MSRYDKRIIHAEADPYGTPSAILLPRESDLVPILAVTDHWREWLDTLHIESKDGEPERDVWLVDTERGPRELHHEHPPGEAGGGVWKLWRWED